MPENVAATVRKHVENFPTDDATPTFELFMVIAQVNFLQFPRKIEIIDKLNALKQSIDSAEKNSPK